MAYEEAVVEVVETVRAGDTTTTRVRLVMGEPPSDPVAPAALYADDATTEVLALHRLVSRGPDGLVFESYELSSALPSAGARLILRSWWSPLSLEAVTAPDGTWQEAQFEGDDHAHCIVSWEEIRRGDRAYRSEAGEWMSVSAFERFVRDDVLCLRETGA